MKKQRLVIALAVALVAVFVIAWGAYYPAYQAKKQEEVRMEQIANYLDGKADDSWWLVNEPIPPVKFETIDLLEKHMKVYSDILKKYRSTTPLSEKICDAFSSRLMATVYSSNGSLLPGRGEIDPKYFEGKQEVCSIPKNLMHRHPSSLYYDSDWQALMIAALEYPEVILAGVLFHEMGHAYYHQILKAPSALAPADSDLHIGEEVIMHELETKIFDVASGGKFLKAVDSVLKRHNTYKTYQKIIQALDEDDFRSLDQSLGVEKAGIQVGGTLVAHYIISTGFRFIDQRSPEKGEKQKIECYRWIRKLHQEH